MVTRVACILIALLLGVTFADTGNLLPNPGLEDWGDKLPTHWRFINFWGAPGAFANDNANKHTGQRSFQISANDSSQSYLFSDPIPVAAGERITASAWVRMKNVPPDNGVVLMANFFNGDGRTEQFDDFAFLKSTDAADRWTHVTGTVTVPKQAETLRLRIGFRNTSGTCWIDDVSLTAEQLLVARANLPQPRITPEMAGVPALVINRLNEVAPVTVLAKLGRSSGSVEIDVPPATTQPVVVPLEIGESRDYPLEISLTYRGKSSPTWAEQRDVFVPPQMVLSPAIPTHWAIEDGPATIEGDIDLAVSKERRAGSALLVALLDEDGKDHAKWASPAPTDGINHFELHPPPLPEGRYRIMAVLTPDKGKPHFMQEQPWTIINRAQSRVVLNKSGYLEHQGKPIFPLGIFNGDGKSEELAAAGFTIQHAYNAANAEPGERPPDAEATRFIDSAHKHELKVLFLIPRGLAFAGDWDGFRRRIRMFKNHPALLAWDEEEGLARGDMDMKSLGTMRRIIAEEDPNHPFMVGDARDIITKITDRSDFFPLAHMDLGMWWWYPIPPGAAKENLLEGDEKTRALELEPPSFLVKRNTDKPLWVGIQSYKKPTASGRFPTPAEYRAQAYIAIIHGAKGLMWYGGSVEGGIFLTPDEGHFTDLKKLARELNDLSDVFMADDDTAPTVTPKDSPVSVRLKKLASRYVLLAANRDARAIDITFHSDSIRAGPVTVLTESRKLNAQDSSLTDHFEPYAVHLYEWPR